MRRPKISGHCQFPQSDDPQQSHARCDRRGGGNRANPQKEFSPCPCPCHYPADRYECGNCGGVLAEAPLWPLDFSDSEEGDVRYTHIDLLTGRATGEECNATVSRNQRYTTFGEEPESDEPEPVVEEPVEYTGFEAPEPDLDEDDLFADMADLFDD